MGRHAERKILHGHHGWQINQGQVASLRHTGDSGSGPFTGERRAGDTNTSNALVFGEEAPLAYLCHQGSPAASLTTGRKFHCCSPSSAEPYAQVTGASLSVPCCAMWLSNGHASLSDAHHAVSLPCVTFFDTCAPNSLQRQAKCRDTSGEMSRTTCMPAAHSPCNNEKVLVNI